LRGELTLQRRLKLRVGSADGVVGEPHGVGLCRRGYTAYPNGYAPALNLLGSRHPSRDVRAPVGTLSHVDAFVVGHAPGSLTAARGSLLAGYPWRRTTAHHSDQ